VTDHPALVGRQPTLRVVPMPGDVNHYGDVFGGWIMSQVDVAGAIVAAQRARGNVTTVSVQQFVFKQPVYVGDILSIYAEITRVGTTSITVNIEVYAARNPADIDVVKVTEATITYVALGADKRPRPVDVTG